MSLALCVNWRCYLNASLQNQLQKNISKIKPREPALERKRSFVLPALLKTVNESLAHEEPDGNSNRNGDHRRAHLNAICVSGETSRLRETSLMERTTGQRLHIKRRLERITHRNQEQHASYHGSKPGSTSDPRPRITKDPNGECSNRRNHI